MSATKAKGVEVKTPSEIQEALHWLCLASISSAANRGQSSYGSSERAVEIGMEKIRQYIGQGGGE